jgi:hypothetical protein
MKPRATRRWKSLKKNESPKENSDEESGPRFASWLPFGRKNAEETEAIAAADDADVAEESKKSGWWKNPFRRQETIEADPFLENELPTEVVVAGKKDAKDKAAKSSLQMSRQRPQRISLRLKIAP